MRCPSPPTFPLRWLILLTLAGAAHAASAAAFIEAGRPTRAAQQAVTMLADAGAEGLLPQDYNAQKLAQTVLDAGQGAALDTRAAEQLDSALTTAVHRYLEDLHSGRVDPRKVHADFTVASPERIDPESYLAAALDSPQPADALRAATPHVPLYASLRSALAQYRGLGDHPAWGSPLPALPQRRLEPGQAWAGLEQLTQRLAALGDLPKETQPPATYDSALQDAVKAFQQRHALTPDGVLGKATLEQLAVTPAERVRQIGLAMERLRWTPLQQGPLPAPHASAAAVPARAARLQPWLHPRRRAGGAGAVRVAGRPGLDTPAHPRGHGPG